MSASGFTPIQLYRTSTASAAPSAGNLAAGELAINLTDEKLYFKNAAGTVKLLASNSGSLGSVTSVDVSGGTTGLTTSGGPITSSGTITLAGTLAVANGGTGVTTSTGTGSVVLSNSPTLVTPTLGAASATSIANGLGAVGTPSYTFTGDLNTGMWSPAADTIAFSANGTERMRLSTAGNLGVNVTPSVWSGFTAVEMSTYGAVASSSGTMDVINNAFNNGSWVYKNTDFASLFRQEAGAFKFFTAPSGTAATAVSFTERMRIDSSGNVGIGNAAIPYTTSGRTVFNVNGTSSTIMSLQTAGSNRGYLYADGSLLSLETETGVALRLTTNAAQPISFTTNGTEKMRITDAGDVGIGISSPGAKLHVATPASGAGVIFRYASGTNNPGLFISTTEATSVCEINATGSTGNNNLAIAISGTERMRIDSSGKLLLGTTSLSTYTANINGTLGVYGGNGLFLQNGSNNAAAAIYNDGASSVSQIQFNAGGGEKMRIDSSGNVGIGTTIGGGRLNVAAPSDARAITILNRTSDNGYGGIYFRSSDGSGTQTSILNERSGTDGGSILFYSKPDGGSIAEIMRLDTTGNVGIGTTAPTKKLMLGGQTGPQASPLALQFSADYSNGSTAAKSKIFLFNDGGSNIYGFGVGSNADVQYHSGATGLTDGNHRFYTNDVERMRIDSSGNLLVGTTSNSLSGTATTFVVNYSGGATHGCNFNQTVSSATYYTQIAFSTAGTVVGEIRSNNTATQYNTSSDVRLKKNIANADDAASLIDALQVRKFDWNVDDSHQRYGFVAQELLEVAPEAVSQPEDPDEMMGVDYSKLVPMLVKEIQSLRARVAQLEGN